ncbi:MAG: glycosyl transferase, partial [SAR202 cluster bacterium]|nr:glycosyl transferase [SAR202 cluster bacterium]
MTQSPYKNKMAIIVATKDRPEQLRSVLSCIQGQSFTPDQIVVVDGGDRTVAEVAQEFGGLPIDY